MVTLKLYRYSGKNNVIDKVLDETTAATLNGVFYDYYDKITPSIKVRTNANLTDLQRFNYCFVPTLNNKYYFVDKITILSTNVFRFDLRLDVLKTYATEIKAATVTVTAKENADNYINSRQTFTDVRPNIEKINFSVNAPFVESGDIILTTIKGNV